MCTNTMMPSGALSIPIHIREPTEFSSFPVIHTQEPKVAIKSS